MLRPVAIEPNPARSVRPANGRLPESRRRFITPGRALIGVASLHLCYLPWAFGGVDSPSLLVSAALGTIALFLALQARREETSREQASPAFRPAQLLFREPVFWLGGILLATVALQGCNPAYRHVAENGRWWLQPADPASWLPAGMKVPYEAGGPWRTLVSWVGPWTLACALRLGVTRRTMVVTLLRVIAINGFLIAAFGMVQRAAGTEAVFGLRSTPSAAIFATFIYRNHAAAYLNLILAVVVLLGQAALRHSSGRDPVRAGAPLLFLVIVGTILGAVLLSFSLAGIGLASAGALVLGLTFVARPVPAGGGRPRRLVALGAVGLAGTIGLIAVQAGAEQLPAQLGAKLDAGAHSLELRRLAARQGLHMWLDRPVLGWGAGCFRYGFTKYQREEPQIAVLGAGRLFWEHQHNDWLEFAIELGGLGLVPVVAAVWLWLRAARRAGLWRHPALRWGAGGLVGLGLHALIDFPLQNPAILTTAVAVACLVLRWAETSATRPGGQARPAASAAGASPVPSGL